MTGRLHALGLQHQTDKATFHGYLDFYEQQLPAPASDPVLLEIGVMDGASLKMWRDYYPNGIIVGVDNTRPTKVNGCAVYRLDATDPADIATLLDYPGIAPFDVIIDDGSHMTADQQRTFDLLWPAVAPGGVYVIEDLHTSHMSNYVNSSQTTLEWIAGLELDVMLWVRAQGEPAGFIARHGFPADAVEWAGREVAESITSVIRKSAGHYNGMQGWIRDEAQP